MITDPIIRDQAYQYFLEEAPVLLETIEQELFSLDNQQRALQVNKLMRAAHTLKGGAANVGLEAIKTVAHSLEDILKALYNPDLVVDAETQTLLFDSYECLRLLLSAQLTQATVDEAEVLARANLIFAQLQTKLADYLQDQEAFPSSEELGIDVIESFFEVIVPEKLAEISDVLADGDIARISEVLHEVAEIFVGLGQSLNLPGLEAIATNTLAALEKNPEAAVFIAETALADFQAAKQQVQEGDRQLGGKPSETLLKLAQGESTDTEEMIAEIWSEPLLALAPTQTIFDKLTQFSQFIEQNFPPNRAKGLIRFAPKVMQSVLGWFHEYRGVKLTDLTLNLLVEISPGNQEAEIQYLDSWLSDFWQFLDKDQVSPSLIFHRHRLILMSLLAVAEFQYSVQEITDIQQSPLIKILRRRINRKQKESENNPPLTKQEKNWLEYPQLRKLRKRLDNLVNSPAEEEELNPVLVDDIWGQQIISEPTEKVEENPVNLLDEDDSPSFTPLEIITEVNNNFNEFIPIEEAQKNEKLNSQTTQQIQIDKTVRVSLGGLEKLNHLVGEMLINQNKNTLKDQKIQTTVQNIIDKIEAQQHIINQLSDCLDGMMLLQDNNQIINTTLTTKNQSFFSINTWLKLEQYREFPTLFKAATEGIADLLPVAEKLKNITKESNQNLKKQQRMLFQMRDELIDIRMSPLANILNRFPRLIQQLSTTHNKKVELKLSGSHILVDKAIEDKLYDPLLHLVRNAFDHGIESPELRRQLGKSETGKIEIRAYHQGSQTIIEVRDNGQGLNFERIKERAIERNLVTAEIANQLPESKLLEFIFEPGFSTSSSVTDLSGRGVGLDVVRSQLQELKGTIAIESRQEEGTTFSLQIPLTLSIARLMVCQAGGIIYALLPDVIEKIILPKANQLQIFEGQKILHWLTETGNYTVPVRRLSDLMKYSRNQAKQETTDSQILTNPVLLLRRNNGLLGLEVDQVLGEQELVIRPLGSTLTPPSYVYGCSILSDSSLTLVIDGTALVTETQNQQTLSTQTTSVVHHSLPNGVIRNQRELSPTKAEKSCLFLVVDDSLSLRQTLAMTLEKAGHRVLQAGDGVEALEKLQQSKAIDLVVCDLEMPNMNGLEFLKAIRKKSELAKIPVVMLTSRNIDKYRQLALQLGAKAYFTKPYAQEDLLNRLLDVIKLEQKTLVGL